MEAWTLSMKREKKVILHKNNTHNASTNEQEKQARDDSKEGNRSIKKSPKAEQSARVQKKKSKKARTHPL